MPDRVRVIWNKVSVRKLVINVVKVAFIFVFFSPTVVRKKNNSYSSYLLNHNRLIVGSMR